LPARGAIAARFVVQCELVPHGSPKPSVLVTACGSVAAALRRGTGMTSRKRNATATSTIMPLPSRAARLVAAVAACSSSAAACAADPGDAPKQDAAIISGGDASPDVGGDPFDAGVDGGRGGEDSAVSPVDVAVADVANEAGAEVGGGSDAGVVDAPPDVASCPTCPLVVEYMTTVTTATAKDISPHLNLLNNGTSAQDLTVVTVRYWYTADGSTSQAFSCDYAAPAVGNCANVTATFVQMPQAKTNADHYMEVSFTGGSIPAGASTGDIQIRFHDTNYAVTFTQTNDYSFDATKTAYAQWSNITLYRSGTLVWGTEPQ
jgi:hypothetical protein